jgi:hypothetical protein
MLKNIVWAFLLPGLISTTPFPRKPEKEIAIVNHTSYLGQDFEPVVVLQLFTSQGCSSCPPADALLKRMTESPGSESLFCIAYHVDYWNYIGWEDPFSHSTYTAKQRAFAAKFGNGQIYTPQLVINGKEHHVGSDAARITSRIEAYREVPSSNSVMVSASRKVGRELQLDYEVLGPFEGRIIRAVLVLDESVTQVKRGENRNRDLMNTHIAIAEVSKRLTAPEGTLMLDIPSTVSAEGTYHLVILTETDTMDITGATRTGFVAGE